MMKVQCAWCRAPMGEKPGPAGMVSHGICPGCYAEQIKPIEDAIQPKRVQQPPPSDQRRFRVFRPAV